MPADSFTERELLDSLSTEVGDSGAELVGSLKVLDDVELNSERAEVDSTDELELDFDPDTAVELEFRFGRVLADSAELE